MIRTEDIRAKLFDPHKEIRGDYLFIGPEVSIVSDASGIELVRYNCHAKLAGAPAWAHTLLDLLKATPIHTSTAESLCKLLSNDALKFLDDLRAKKFISELEAHGAVLAAYKARVFPIANLDTKLEFGSTPKDILLPAPIKISSSLHDITLNRRSSFETTTGPMTPQQIATMLAYGYGSLKGLQEPFHATIPSAGGLRPLLLHYHSTENGKMVSYRYIPLENRLRGISSTIVTISRLCNDQETTAGARALVSITYDYQKNSTKYRERGIDLALIESGHAAQNITACAGALGFGSRGIAGLELNAFTLICDLEQTQVTIYSVAIY